VAARADRAGGLVDDTRGLDREDRCAEELAQQLGCADDGLGEYGLIEAS
jgi:hypothetical protein